MPPEISERDWKVCRELREVALDRLCQRALRDARVVVENSSKSHHERFRDLFTLVADRNEEIARGFDGPKRSEMFHQQAFIHNLGLLEIHELGRFSEDTRERVVSLARLF